MSLKILDKGYMYNTGEFDLNFCAEIDTINDLHPILALNILKGYGFQKVPAYDETYKMNIYKVENALNWAFKMDYLEDKPNEEINDAYIEKMDYLVDYVNSIPATLNKKISTQNITLPIISRVGPFNSSAPLYLEVESPEMEIYDEPLNFHSSNSFSLSSKEDEKENTSENSNINI